MTGMPVNKIGKSNVSEQLQLALYQATVPHVDNDDKRWPSGNLVVFRVETQDFPRNNNVTEDYILEIFFSNCGIGRFFQTNFWDALKVTNPGIPPWVKLNKKLTDYPNPESGPEMYLDVLEQAAVNWSALDSNNDGAISPIDAQFIFLIPNNAWASRRPITFGDVVTPAGDFDFGSREIIVFSLKKANESDAHINPIRTASTVAHELGHAFFNLVDRYGDNNTRFTGQYDMMSNDRSWKNFTIYDRMKVASHRYKPPIMTPQRTEYVYFRPSDIWPDALILIDPQKSGEYWMLEYRSRTEHPCKFDQGLPESGLAVWWVKRKGFPKDTPWPEFDDIRLVSALSPEDDPDGNGLQKDAIGFPIPDPNSGYRNPKSGSLFQSNSALFRPKYSDGTDGPFSLRVLDGDPQGITVAIYGRETFKGRLYNAIWRLGHEDEIGVYGWSEADLLKEYDAMFKKGYRFHALSTYIENGTPLFDAIWRPGDQDEVGVYGWKEADFLKKYDELFKKGYRLHLLNAYIQNGIRLYNAIWRPGNQNEVGIYGWKEADFLKEYDAMYKKGFRLHLLTTYMLGGNRLHDAVWRPSQDEEVGVYGWKLSDLVAKIKEMRQNGFGLHLLNAYAENGESRYSAVWRKTSLEEPYALQFRYSDFRAAYDDRFGQGWRLHLLSTMVE